MHKSAETVTQTEENVKLIIAASSSFIDIYYLIIICSRIMHVKTPELHFFVLNK